MLRENFAFHENNHNFISIFVKNIFYIQRALIKFIFLLKQLEFYARILFVLVGKFTFKTVNNNNI